MLRLALYLGEFRLGQTLPTWQSYIVLLAASDVVKLLFWFHVTRKKQLSLQFQCLSNLAPMLLHISSRLHATAFN
jgi:hypothetical protein